MFFPNLPPQSITSTLGGPWYKVVQPTNLPHTLSPPISCFDKVSQAQFLSLFYFYERFLCMGFLFNCMFLLWSVMWQNFINVQRILFKSISLVTTWVPLHVFHNPKLLFAVPFKLFFKWVFSMLCHCVSHPIAQCWSPTISQPNHLCWPYALCKTSEPVKHNPKYPQ
jgi:hypothetical protein